MGRVASAEAWKVGCKRAAYFAFEQMQDLEAEARYSYVSTRSCIENQRWRREIENADGARAGKQGVNSDGGLERAGQQGPS